MRGTRERSDQRHARSIVAWNRALGSLSSGGIGIQRRHGDMRAGLIHKHQLRALQLLALLAPGLTRRFILLACASRVFFFVSNPERLGRG